MGTPFAAKGYAYHTWKRAFGRGNCDVLCWNASSTLMNPTLSTRIVKRAIDEDPVAASVEYCTSPGLFRQDIDAFVSRAVVESLVVGGRKELAPRKDLRYGAFADVSGGRHDDAAICIGHKEGRMVIIDCLERYKAPHNPFAVVAKMCSILKCYALSSCVGDTYAAEWCCATFQHHEILYSRATTSHWKHGASAVKPIAKPKSVLYSELLPRLHSEEIELLDDETLVTQLSGLQRRTRSGGRDSIDHAPGAHDDVANVVVGVCDVSMQRRIVIGAVTARDDYEHHAELSEEQESFRDGMRSFGFRRWQ